MKGPCQQFDILTLFFWKEFLSSEQQVFSQWNAQECRSRVVCHNLFVFYWYGTSFSSMLPWVSTYLIRFGKITVLVKLEFCGLIDWAIESSFKAGMARIYQIRHLTLFAQSETPSAKWDVATAANGMFLFSRKARRRPSVWPREACVDEQAEKRACHPRGHPRSWQDSRTPPARKEGQGGDEDSCQEGGGARSRSRTRRYQQICQDEKWVLSVDNTLA